ncbi:hypothetical protein [Symbiopectobacterium purcellii]|uniref:hypothetical protein n=1 Tax=Symbiopectobacterium purcellii TaxID=2871826 RepID=UPI003F84011A
MRQRSIAGCYQNNVAWLYHVDDSDYHFSDRQKARVAKKCCSPFFVTISALH